MDVVVDYLESEPSQYLAKRICHRTPEFQDRPYDLMKHAHFMSEKSCVSYSFARLVVMRTYRRASRTGSVGCDAETKG